MAPNSASPSKLLAAHLGRLLVVPQPALDGPLDELDLRDHLGPHPLHLVHLLRGHATAPSDPTSSWGDLRTDTRYFPYDDRSDTRQHRGIDSGLDVQSLGRAFLDALVAKLGCLGAACVLLLLAAEMKTAGANRPRSAGGVIFLVRTVVG